jgi:hypothetical protein
MAAASVAVAHTAEAADTDGNLTQNLNIHKITQR